MSDKVIIGCVVRDRFVLCKYCLHTLFDAGCNEVHKSPDAYRKFEGVV